RISHEGPNPIATFDQMAAKMLADEACRAGYEDLHVALVLWRLACTKSKSCSARCSRPCACGPSMGGRWAARAHARGRTRARHELGQCISHPGHVDQPD